MKLIVDTVGPTDQLAIDIDTMIEECEDADGLFALVLARVCRYVHVNSRTLDDFYVVQLDGDDEGGLDVPDDSASDFTHLREACQLFWYLSEKDRWVDEARVFARINDNWKYVDFDDLKSEVEDNYHAEFDTGDEASWAEEYTDEVDLGIPDHLKSYFDYEAYAEALIEDFDQYEWDGKTYLYHR
jgi:antirestriction protein ArdA